MTPQFKAYDVDNLKISMILNICDMYRYYLC